MKTFFPIELQYMRYSQLSIYVLVIESQRMGSLMIRVLLIEDDPLIAKILIYSLEKEEIYSVVHAKTAGEALARARDKVDIILMDVLLPDANGIDLSERMRTWHDCPIIFISCLDDSDTIVQAFSSGGDAFITKPFDNKVLIACMEASLRRYAIQRDNQPKNTIEGCGLVLDANRHVVKKRDQEIKLSDIEFRLLSFLMNHAGKEFSPKELYKHIWGISSYGDSRTVTVHIHNLRQKLEDDPSEPKFILMVWGKGYAFTTSRELSD